MPCLSERANEGTVKRKLDIMSCCAIKTAPPLPMGAWGCGKGLRGGRPREALSIERQFKVVFADLETPYELPQLDSPISHNRNLQDTYQRDPVQMMMH